MARIVLRGLTPPAREMEKGEMKSIFGGIIIVDGTIGKSYDYTWSSSFSLSDTTSLTNILAHEDISPGRT